MGYGNSTLKLCEAVGAPVVKGGKVVHLLKQQEKRHAYFRQRQQFKLYKSKRKYYRKVRYQLYDERNEIKFCKSLTDPKLPKKRNSRAARVEHSYHRK